MKIVLYGAGKRGRAIYSFLKTQGLSEHVYGFCDKRGKENEKSRINQFIFWKI